MLRNARDVTACSAHPLLLEGLDQLRDSRYEVPRVAVRQIAPSEIFFSY